MLRNCAIEVECPTFVGGATVVAGPVRAPKPIRFGDDFEFDFSTYTLRLCGRTLKLERIPTEVLAMLVEQRGQIVTREHIVERIWGKDIFLDTDNSINGAIRKVRQVLKDDPEQPRFIQTITGKGYRFIGPVTDPKAPKAITASKLQAPVTELPTVKPPRSRRAMVLAISILLMAGVAAYLKFHSQARPAASRGRLMLAVLPFENLTGDASQDYFSDGLTEEMISQLGDLDPKHLGVIARTSVMHYKHTPEPLDQIGRTLGVQYVLEGSVRRDSDRMRIAAQLIQTGDQTHLWTREYDREVSNVLAVQGEIAREIADQIQLTLGDVNEPAGPAGQPTLSAKAFQAYDLYLKGRYFWNKRTAQGLQQAIEYFQQAVNEDPEYARAYAGLAESYALMGGYTGLPAKEFIPKARAAARRALEIDEQLPEAHTALAVIAQNYDWDWATAEREYRRAIQLNPNYATGHHWYAECLALQGRFGEAFPEMESARQLDPLSLIISTDYGAILYFSRQYDRAIEQFRGVLDVEPNFPRARMLTWAYAQQGLFTDALAETEEWRRRDDSPPWSWAMIAYVSGRSGDQARTKLALQQLEQSNRHQAVDSLAFAVAYIGMRDNEKALLWLEKACLEHSSSLTAIKVDPTYDPLRSDPRFQKLVRRVGLAQ
jgi:TolB-like protein/DNA-binding winged helix-turn-helix (wHTH) protein/Tfp pilus assembly protein PilF